MDDACLSTSPTLAEVGSGIVAVMGDSDANGIEANDEWIYGDLGVLRIGRVYGYPTLS